MSEAPMPSHWAAQRERGSFALMRLTAWAVRVLGRRAMAPLLYLIVLYFYLFGRSARDSARQYQGNLARWSGRTELQRSTRSVYRQFMSFAEALLDKLDVWSGRVGRERLVIHDPANLHASFAGTRGQLLVGSHLGNLEICRALAEMGGEVQMNVLVHTRHAEQFNRLLDQSGADNLRLIQVSELNPATMLQLSQRLERGEWLAIAGDRVPLHGGRIAEVDFLGRPAAFPQGPWLLAGLLECPVNLLFCLKHEGRFHVHLEPFAERIHWRRAERDAVIKQAVQRYADRLAARCLEAPLQWFNFYPFWNTQDRRRD
ncbi:glycosyl transferase [Pseudomonas stutzeri]|uniref:Glycosyl transferase n=1 Tax=Stutzerimonas stutzeri TaxID=316 RepID=A0A2N8RXZ5_STUST|nr:glycosyl transferase [Stutzerimonas stutzeri]MCQ4296190.1 glycosyl transferase [Stutzerimonas stutzeri]PNF79222.1 glycosyl transferase [Stutzerimonas stutzeri]